MFILLFLISVPLATAQEEVVVIRKSTDKVMIDGKAYYIHVVRDGHTLFSISRVYNISQKEISKNF